MNEEMNVRLEFTNFQKYIVDVLTVGEGIPSTKFTHSLLEGFTSTVGEGAHRNSVRCYIWGNTRVEGDDASKTWMWNHLNGTNASYDACRRSH